MAARSASRLGALALDAAPAAVGLAAIVAVWAWRHGYYFGVSNQTVQLLAVRRALDPSFARNDWFLDGGGEGVRQGYVALVAAVARLVGLERAVLALWCAQLGALTVGAYRLGRVLLGERAGAALGAVACALIAQPALGGNFLVREMLLPGPLAKALALLGLALALERRWAALPALVGATALHVLVGLEAAALVVAGFALRWARARRAGTPPPSLRWAAVAAGAWAVPAALTLAPVVRGQVSERPLSAAEWVQLLGAWRAPWHYLPSSFPPASYAAFGALLVGGAVAALPLGIRRPRPGWLVPLAGLGAAALLLAATVAPLSAGGRRGAVDLAALLALAAVAEAAAPPRERGAPCAVELGAATLALAAMALSAWLFVEVLPIALALKLQLVRTTVFAKALALVLVGGALARALVRGPIAAWLAAAPALVALFCGRTPLIVAPLAALAALPALGPRAAAALALGAGGATAAALAQLGLGDARLGAVGAALVVLAGGARLLARSGPARRRRALALVALAGAAALLSPTVARHAWAHLRPAPPAGDLERLARWARTGTRAGAIVLAPPQYDQWRLLAERALVVDFKAVPFGADAMRAWYARLMDLSGRPGAPLPRADPRATYGDRMRELGRGYAALGAEALRRLGRRYGAQYVVREGGRPLPFPLLRRVGRFALYALP